MVRIGWVSGERCTLSLKFHLPALSVWRVSAARVLLWYLWGAGAVLPGTLVVMIGWDLGDEGMYAFINFNACSVWLGVCF